MEISSVRITALQIYARLDTKGTSQSTVRGTKETAVDTLILSAQSRDNTVYSSDGFRAVKSTVGDAALLVEETPGSKDYLLEYRSTYLEIVRERVAYLLQDLSRGTETADESSAVSASAASETSLAGSYYSPEKTASRIIDFALSFYSGGNREDFARMVQEAVMKGFEQAKAAMGGILPQEADRTVSLVLNALSQFAAGDEI
jgi:hypothetical protein